MIAALRHFLLRMVRDRGLITQSFMFFALSVLVSVFAIGSEDVLLAAVLPSFVWVLMLLSSLLGLPELVEGENLDDLMLARVPFPALMFAKTIAHFIATTLPIALLAPPILAVLLDESYLPMPALWAGFLLGGLTFSCMGLLGAALTLDSRRNAALQAMIVLPLSIPALIFGAGSIMALQLNQGWVAPTAFLGAFACASLTLAPFAAAWIIRMKTVTP